VLLGQAHAHSWCKHRIETGRHLPAHCIREHGVGAEGQVTSLLLNRAERDFEPFYRAPGANHSGAGLGLAIAKGFIEANGGTIHVESLPGQGATFVVTFPLDEPAPPLPS
jgi:signal transduction histidine kinase